MTEIKFNTKWLDKLNDPKRLEIQPTQTMWEALGGEESWTSLIDIGAGTGFFSKEFLKFMPQGKVLALDIKDTMLEWMAENLKEVKEGRIIPCKMQEAATPLEDEVGDAAMMINLHHELHEPARMLQEVLRILRPGGKVLIVDWLPIETPMGPPQKIRVTPQAIEAQLTTQGFTQVEAHDILPMHSCVVGQKPPLT